MKFSFLWLVFDCQVEFLKYAMTSTLTYSYRHNHLYNNDTLTTVFNYDFAKIVFCGVLIFVSIGALLQELLLNKQSH